MECIKCGGPTWDNRAKKAEGKFKPNAPDFSCKDKGCGWNSGFGKATTVPQNRATMPSAASGVGIPAVIAAQQAGAYSHVGERDLAIQELFWDSFDAVLQGIAKRKLVEWAKPETITSLTGLLFIQRSKG